jgi:hypothetical protein
MLSGNIVRFEMPDGAESPPETLADALENRLHKLDEMAATCLLMLHLGTY